MLFFFQAELLFAFHHRPKKKPSLAIVLLFGVGFTRLRRQHRRRRCGRRRRRRRRRCQRLNG